MCPDAASGQGAPEPQQQPGAAANGGGLGARPDAELGGAEMRNGAAEPPGAWLCVGAGAGVRGRRAWMRQVLLTGQLLPGVHTAKCRVCT